MIKGISIKLINFVEIGKDSIGDPIYEERIKQVDDVLVQFNSESLVTDTDLDGKKMMGTLAIPKGDTNIWENQDVEIFGKRYHVCSYEIQGIEENIPLRWNKQVKIERYD